MNITSYTDDYAALAEGVAKKYQAKDGGLNDAGRKHFKKTEGANLKPPVSKEAAKKSPTKGKRRKSFCSRMGGQIRHNTMWSTKKKGTIGGQPQRT